MLLCRSLWLKMGLAAGLLLGVDASTAWAQTATLRGKVTDAQTGEALPQANVQITAAGVQTGGASNLDGEYEVSNLAAGEYTVIVSYVGYERRVINNITVKAGETKVMNVALTGTGVLLNPVVISASRRQEKALEAPAAITVLEAPQIRGRAVTTATDYLRGLPAVDVATNGIAQSNVVVRGFNNIFSTALLSLTDNRYVAVPSLRLNAYNFIPLTGEDIARIEVVSGPGAALYGPNSAAGVMHIITKSPFESEGTSISVGGGGRDFFNFARKDDLTPSDLNHPNGRVGASNIYMASFRHAQILSDKAAFKVSGQYYRGRDWQDYYGFIGLPKQITRFRITADGIVQVGGPVPNTPNFDVEKIAGEARFDLRLNNDASLIFNAGYNRGDQIELTGLGPAQADGWAYLYGQARFNYKNLFLQGFVNASDAGGTYILNTGQLIEDNSKVIAGQAQHSVTLALRQRFTYGLDAILTRPDTKGSINGRNEDNDNINEFGVYLQSETKVLSKLDVVAAARIDDHNHIEDPVFSPRAALVFKPASNHTLRATYNRAFSTPSTNNLFLDILLARTPLFDVRTYGVPNTGYNFSFSNGRPQMVSRFYTPGVYVDSDVINPLWPGIHEYLSQIAQDPEALKQLPPPFNVLTPAQAQIIVGILPQRLTAGPVPSIFKRLDLVAAQTGSSDPFIPVEVSSVQNIKPIKPTIHNNFELGYKGIISQKLLVTVDIYHTKIRDFVGPLKVETPNVFANGDSLSTVLAAQLAADPQAVATLQQFGLTPEVFAGVFAGFLQGIPLGIISPQELKNGAEVMQTYRNFGQVSLNGMDVSLSFFAGPQWTFSGNYSFVTKHGLNIFKRPNRVFVRNLDGIANLALNAPGNKAALSIQYRAIDRGYDFELRGRYVDGFPMESGAYAGEIQTYTIFDLNFGWDLPFSKNTRFALNVQNMFDKKHLEFIGAPILGRLMMARLTQTF
ncbi:TonB-dependent receptor [candidate division KSB1 bacterium]|nr:TonB-dependent receptor [candidate division KSB1 bacterium]